MMHKHSALIFSTFPNDLRIFLKMKIKYTMFAYKKYRSIYHKCSYSIKISVRFDSLNLCVHNVLKCSYT